MVNSEHQQNFYKFRSIKLLENRNSSFEIRQSKIIDFTIRREIRAKSEDGNLRVKRIIFLRECVALCTLESIGDTLESNFDRRCDWNGVV